MRIVLLCVKDTLTGKQRQKESGRGRPTPSLITSVKTVVIVMAIENRRPGMTR